MVTPLKRGWRRKPSGTDGNTATDAVGQAFENASRMMSGAGFEIGEDVRVVVDRKLPFMGYTATPQGQKNHTIVVSGMALESGMVEGLLVHEMSHIYRTVTKHPSHDQGIISNVLSPIVKKELNRNFQLQALHAAVNHIQDLYADDISLEVFKKNQGKLFPPQQMSEFFLNWLKDEPVQFNDAERDRWTNASIMFNNAFALSNMERHGIPDPEKKAMKLNARFLTRIHPEVAREFDYLHKLMVGLKEDIGAPEFKELLTEYLASFLAVVRSI